MSTLIIPNFWKVTIFKFLQKSPLLSQHFFSFYRFSYKCESVAPTEKFVITVIQYFPVLLQTMIWVCVLLNNNFSVNT